MEEMKKQTDAFKRAVLEALEEEHEQGKMPWLEGISCSENNEVEHGNAFFITDVDLSDEKVHELIPHICALVIHAAGLSPRDYLEIQAEYEEGRSDIVFAVI